MNGANSGRATTSARLESRVETWFSGQWSVVSGQWSVVSKILIRFYDRFSNSFRGRSSFYTELQLLLSRKLATDHWPLTTDFWPLTTNAQQQPNCRLRQSWLKSRRPR